MTISQLVKQIADKYMPVAAGGASCAMKEVPYDGLLSVKDLACALRRSRTYVFAMKRCGFCMPVGQGDPGSSGEVAEGALEVYRRCCVQKGWDQVIGTGRCVANARARVQQSFS